MAERAAKGIMENIEEALFRFFLPQILPRHPNVEDQSIRVPIAAHTKLFLGWRVRLAVTREGRTCCEGHSEELDLFTFSKNYATDPPGAPQCGGSVRWGAHHGAHAMSFHGLALPLVVSPKG
jgi:hypothetical protein